ncbi:MAG: hypothetical protein GC168_20665 [Candidatus Hydrogenedens sp.]|nr:hypothetical protein [Candidatus Hydrogenedens sp.]
MVGDALADLETMVLASLFSDRRALPDDRLPDAPSPSLDRRGWCGDALRTVADDRWGSRLWLLAREKQTAETRRRAEDYAREALQWLTDDGWATAVTVTAEWQRTGVLGLQVVTEAPAGVVRKSFRLPLNGL